MLRFALTVFLSAFLLFQVQPLIGKYILPWFGGGPAVWTACMLFFQVLLLVGYAYAHLISTRLPLRWGIWLHLGLLAVSIGFLPISPDPAVWKPSPDDKPTLHILLLLTVNVGVPYLLLASTSPLIQRWFNWTHPERSPYRLYALSNTGSLLALLTYPFVVEPLLALGRQVAMWSWTYASFVALGIWCAARVTASLPSGSERHTVSPTHSVAGAAVAVNNRPPALPTVLLWLLLAAAASSMLLATTNQMCQEVAVVPFLWILPLALYLLSFIVSFDHPRWYHRRGFGVLLGASTVAACAVLWGGSFVDIRVQILVYAITLFACCMGCHGELARAKPHPQYLTLFYLVLSAGGALGGLFVAVAASRLFLGYWEYHVSLGACVLLTAIAAHRHPTWRDWLREPAWGNVGVMLLLGAVLFGHVHLHGRNALAASRNFYGVLRLLEVSGDAGEKRELSHGKIVHGSQFIDDERRSWPTAYYGPDSGIGLAMRHHPRRYAADPQQQKLSVGVVGLGAGTAAVHGRPGDYLRFYEIDPEVLSFAERYFTYSQDSKAQVDVILGDARVQLEREAERGERQGFDVLAVDAFSSDAIPIHLLTLECVELYWEHLREDGILLFHITNRSLDLTPVIRGLARQRGCRMIRMEQQKDEERGLSRSVWMALTHNEAFLERPEIRTAALPCCENERPALVWTDDFASLWQVLKR